MISRAPVASAVLATSIAVLCGAKPAEACSCVDVWRSAEQAAAAFRADYDKATAVFVGTAITDRLNVATFEVHQVWKGELGAHVELATGAPIKPQDPLTATLTISSDELHFAAGKTYLVFAYGNAARMASQCCSPTHELSSPAAAKDLEALSTFATPRPPNLRMEPTLR